MILKSKRGLILILSSPSGAGKTTLAKKIEISDSNFKISVSYTTRTPRLNEINGVNFIWNENAPKHKQGQKDIGLIAQEVEKVIPSAVQKNPEGNLTVAYDKLVPLLVETVKKQQKQIDDLNLRLNKLENR